MTGQIYSDGTGTYILIAGLTLLILLIVYIYYKIKKTRERIRLNRRQSLKAVYYENSIRELQQEVEHWQQAYKSLENECALMQDSLTKARIKWNKNE